MYKNKILFRSRENFATKLELMKKLQAEKKYLQKNTPDTSTSEEIQTGSYKALRGSVDYKDDQPLHEQEVETFFGFNWDF